VLEEEVPFVVELPLPFVDEEPDGLGVAAGHDVSQDVTFACLLSQIMIIPIVQMIVVDCNSYWNFTMR
jgi:hypothetical protein